MTLVSLMFGDLGQLEPVRASDGEVPLDEVIANGQVGLTHQTRSLGKDAQEPLPGHSRPTWFSLASRQHMVDLSQTNP